ncbi:MAG: dephospho-CoA kinase [Planctomycetaceae bacterium]
MNDCRVPVIGFVGGVGSGKSSLSAAIGRRLRCVLLDADREGHAVLALPAIQSQLHQTFGDSIFDKNGAVSRPTLGKLVFGNEPIDRERRLQLEAIVHPEIRRRLSARIDQHRAAVDVDLILLDAAVMLESGWSGICDLIVFVDTPESLRLSRVQQSRGWSQDEFARREASQWPLDRKRQAADIVVHNDTEIDAVAQNLLTELLVRFPQLASQFQRPETCPVAQAPA